jgi:hypothetical protein
MKPKTLKKSRRKEPMRDSPFDGTLISVKLDSELRNRLERYAESEMRNLASTVRLILSKHLPK